MIDSQNENLNTNRPERNNENRKSQKKSKLKKNQILEQSGNDSTAKETGGFSKINDQSVNSGLNNKEPHNNNGNIGGLEAISEVQRPKELQLEEGVYHFYINDPEKNTKVLLLKDNKIRTTKYNIFTFLPKALLYQFMRLANVYFAIITVIQCIPALSPLGPVSAIFPLLFVLAVSLIREGFEDWKRFKTDKKQNEEEVEVYREGGWQIGKSGSLRVGEIVYVIQDGTFPADLLLLDSNLNDGICYIETGSLDGEKTLKLKVSPNFTKGKFRDRKANDNNANNNNNNNPNNNINSNCEEGVNNMNSAELSDNNNVISSSPLSSFVLDGVVQCDLPNPALYTLNGKAVLSVDGLLNQFPLDAKSLLLKGARLRNTEWVVGIVLYAGHNCKIMKNAKEGNVKYSKIELTLNRLLVGILSVQILLSLVSAVCHKVYYSRNSSLVLSGNSLGDTERKMREVSDYNQFSVDIESTLSFFTYFLLLNTMIPISLIITLEISKVVQGMFINLDCRGYSDYRKKFISANSVSLNEELGLVDYVFSDKTGTLTCNRMTLKFCVIGKQCFEFVRNGKDSDEFKNNMQLREKEGIVPFENYDMVKQSVFKEEKMPSVKYEKFAVKSKKNKNNVLYIDDSEKLMEEYWKCLSLCHDCNIQNGEYIGMSPDNLELVKGAQCQGFKFDVSECNTQAVVSLVVGPKNINHQLSGPLSHPRVSLRDRRRSQFLVQDEELRGKIVFERLKQVEFTSDRKRESVLVKEEGVYKLYIKGADSIIEPRLDPSTPKEILERSKYFVNLFSSRGYRTLFVAMRILSEEEANNFLQEIEQAEMMTENKDKTLEEIYNRLESGLVLLGCTIVEDKLQDKVPETIKELREAGIKIWMLTGDKLSTAYNIGLSCNLISSDIRTFFVEGIEKKFNESLKVVNENEREQVILNFVKEYNEFITEDNNSYMNKKEKPFGVLVDEKALLTITENEEMSNIFLRVACKAVAVICCRVSPLQKSQVVKLLKTFDPSKTTLAIGDGGNDVSMILEAHIGIGIYGEEGLRAAQSSDYAIGEFKVLRRLLFHHGYLNLTRNSEMIIYFFYKNFVFTIVHFFYGFLNDFSGQTIIDDFFITLYNLVFTSLPLGVRGILDVSLREEDGKLINALLPILYKEGRDKPIFSILHFILGLVKGTVHSLINYFFCVWFLKYEVDDDGTQSNLWLISVVLYTNILLIVTVDLMLYTKYHTWINFAIIGVTSFLVYILFLIIVQYSSLFHSVATMHQTFSSQKTWLTMFLVVGFCGAIDLASLSFKSIFYNGVTASAMRIKDKNIISKKNLECLPEDIRNWVIKKLGKDFKEEIEMVYIKKNTNEADFETAQRNPYVSTQNKEEDKKVENMMLNNVNKVRKIMVTPHEDKENKQNIYKENSVSKANLLGDTNEQNTITGSPRRRNKSSRKKKKKDDNNNNNNNNNNNGIGSELNSPSISPEDPNLIINTFPQNKKYNNININNSNNININININNDNFDLGNISPSKTTKKNTTHRGIININDNNNESSFVPLRNKTSEEMWLDDENGKSAKIKEVSVFKEMEQEGETGDRLKQKEDQYHVQDAADYYSNKRLRKGFNSM